MSTSPWVGINSKAILDPRISEATRKVLLTLEMKAGNRAPRVAKCTNQWLREQTGLAERTVRKALARCLDLGLIDCRQTDHRGRMVVRLPDIEPPYTKSWRALWYRPDWPFWKKHAFLVILAAHRATDHTKMVIKYGNKSNGLIELCHLRGHVKARNWSRARKLLEDFLDELETMGVLTVVRAATRETATAVRIDEDRLHDITATIDDLFANPAREADGNLAREADGNPAREADTKKSGKSVLTDAPSGKVLSEPSPGGGRAEVAGKGNHAIPPACPIVSPGNLAPPPGPSQEQMDCLKHVVRTGLTAAGRIEYQESRAAGEDRIIAAFISNLDPGWEPADVLKAIHSDDFKGLKTFCWTYLDPDKCHTRIGARLIKKTNSLTEKRLCSSDMELHDVRILLGNTQHLVLPNKSCQIYQDFATALQAVFPDLRPRKSPDGWLEYDHGRLSPEKKEAVYRKWCEIRNRPAILKFRG